MGWVSPVWAPPAEPRSPLTISRTGAADLQQAKERLLVWCSEGFWKPTMELQGNGLISHEVLFAGLYSQGANAVVFVLDFQVGLRREWHSVTFSRLLQSSR